MMREFMLTILLLSLVLVLFLVGVSLTRRERNRSIYFTVLCMGTGLYLFGYCLEVLSPTLEAAKNALIVQNAGIAFMGPFSLLCILNICHFRYFRPWMGITAGLYGFLVFLVVLTNNSHFLYYSTLEFLPISNMHYLSLGHGPLYNFQQGVVALCACGSYAILIHRFVVWPKLACRQLKLVTLGVTLSFFVNVLYFTRAIPHYVDPTPFAMVVSMGCMMIGIMKYRMYDLLPVASGVAMETMDCALVVLDNDWGFQSANGKAKTMFPALNQLYGTEPINQVANWPDVLMQNPGPEEVTFDLELDGKFHTFSGNVNAVELKGKQFGWTVMIRDITQTVQLMEQLKTMATTDFLTGIYNRRQFMEVAKQELELARREGLPTSLVLFDLDHFKEINDSYGHQAGDEVLVAMANAIRKELRPYDVFGRYGGEEFVIFSIGMNTEDAQRFAQRLCDTAREVRLEYQGYNLRITASFGVVEMPPGSTLDDATAAADKAMYQAKQHGRNCVELGHIRYKYVGQNSCPL